GGEGADGGDLPDRDTADAGPRHLAADRAAFAAVGDRLLERARAEGDLRPGVTSEDITVLLWMVTELAEHSADLRPDAYRRYLRLLADGLRDAPDRAPLPDGPDADDVAAISRRWASR
ncbi:hypothetical protein ICW40_17020, partial [Actinotalea ferrariae]|uniref:SbtR family transcriptional regulator n=1 Tax=Actinotalea ferrariae TaxID=1386098 RepID=UPI001C8B47AE